MKKSVKQWMTLLAICMAGGVIYKLAYLRDVFYVPMGEAFGANNTQLGWMMTAFAITQFLCYLPGGWITDVVPIKILVPASLISTGLCGFWLATYHLSLLYWLFKGCWASQLPYYSGRR